MAGKKSEGSSSAQNKKTKEGTWSPAADLITAPSVAGQLPNAPPVSSVLSIVKDRFNAQQYHTHAGAQALLSVSPHTDPSGTGDDAAEAKRLVPEVDARAYAYGKVVDDADPKVPSAHPYRLMADTWRKMVRSKKDQAILLLGENGSGKSTALNQLLEEASAIAHRKMTTTSSVENDKKDSKIGSLLLRAQTILKAFGHAKTTVHPDAARYGQVLQLQYDVAGKLLGARTSEYNLDRSRASGHFEEGERNFNVFYQLLAGAPAEDKVKFSLQDASKYKLLKVAHKQVKRSAKQDTDAFDELKHAMQSMRIKRKEQTLVFSLLAAMLHLGNLDFVLSQEQNGDGATVKDAEVLTNAAVLLGLPTERLEGILLYRTKLIRKELATVYLTIDEAFAQRDQLIDTIYSLLFGWVVAQINERLLAKSATRQISIVKMAGFHDTGVITPKSQHLWELLNNYLADKMQEFALQETGTKVVAPAAIASLDTTANNLFYLLEQQSVRVKRGKDRKLMDDMVNAFGGSSVIKAKALSSAGGKHGVSAEEDVSFTVAHYADTVQYTAHGIVAANAGSINIDFVNLAHGTTEIRPSKNTLLVELFNHASITTESTRTGVLTSVHQSVLPVASPSFPSAAPAATDAKLSKAKADSDEDDDDDEDTANRSIASQTKVAVESLCKGIRGCDVSYIFNVKGNNQSHVGKLNAKAVEMQLEAIHFPDILATLGGAFSIDATDFTSSYAKVAGVASDDPKGIASKLGLTLLQAQPDKQGRYLFKAADWRQADFAMRAWEKEQIKLAKHAKKQEEAGTEISFDGSDAMSEGGNSYVSESESTIAPESEAGETKIEISLDPAFRASANTLADPATVAATTEDGKVTKDGKTKVKEQRIKLSKIRKRWIAATWFCTWWIPPFALRWFGGMKRGDIQMAWREKFTICTLIGLFCCAVIFFVVGIPLLLCPNKYQYSLGQLTQYSKASNLWSAVYGEIYDYTNMPHSAGQASLLVAAGIDATKWFHRNQTWCNFTMPTAGDYFDYTSVYTHTVPSTLALLTKGNKIWKGSVAFTPEQVASSFNQPTSNYIIVNSVVYNVTQYIMYNLNYLGPRVTSIIQQANGGDYSQQFNMNPDALAMIPCMDLLHRAGVLDTRKDLKCQVSNGILLAFTCTLVAIMMIKFLASLQFGRKSTPQNYDKFVICQVPCYTEGVESLKRTLNSLAELKYDDKRKLLFIVADGVIIGSGNDLPTPRIVLNILGVDPNIEPESHAFVSLGDGSKQYNRAKVYTGLYDCTGHLVPFMVVVKTGNPAETMRAGNRGKRDSQMILMRYFNKVHYGLPMSALELEMYHQMKNVIGVNPSFYEFVLMVDADTEVMSDSLNRLVARCVQDTNISALCGETMVANEEGTKLESWVTMMQVYEYYISHYLAKAFESLFGTVTCLPGCFSMYRLRSHNNVPILINKGLIDEYSENAVDTLHKKNLLHLGEDRYLTTLMMKHFPHMKQSFSPEAKCRTNAPERWPILLSQRRRWINSTVHNLAELLLLQQLCGFCCFSMRFIVMLDLMTTMLSPVALPYFIYMLYSLAVSIEQDSSTFPLIACITLAAAYGTQVIVFLLRKQWQYIGWMVIYLAAMPLFSFIIPVYSFWHMDDFSWGNTRVVLGESGDQKFVAEVSPFDPATVPMKTWAEHEAELNTAAASQSMVNGGEYDARTHVSAAVPGGSVAQPVYSGAPGPASIVSAYPSEAQIAQWVQDYLSMADLSQVTKKQVRRDATAFFGIDLSPSRDLINAVIDQVVARKQEGL